MVDLIFKKPSLNQILSLFLKLIRFDSNNKIPTLITLSQSALYGYQNLPSVVQFKLVIIFTCFVVCFHVVHLFKIYAGQCDLKQNIHKFKESIKSYAN